MRSREATRYLGYRGRQVKQHEALSVEVNLCPMRLLICLVGFLLLVGATQPSPAQSAAPSLPVVDEKACPFEGCRFGKWKALKQSTLYNTWRDHRVEVGRIAKGDVVTGLTGVHLTKKPDTIRLLKKVSGISLEPGGIFYRYMYHGEGFADIWANGQWLKEFDCSFVTEQNGDGCSKNCSAVVVENGIKKWWVQVKTKAGLVGWTLSDDNFGGMDALGSSD
jgi:hypothetical protein